MSTPRRTDRALRAWLLLLAVAMLIVTSALQLHAQGLGPVTVQGIADGELWATDAKSNLLTRNGGRPGEVGRLQLWGALEPARGLVVFAQGEVEAGSARDGGGAGVYTDQYGIRYASSGRLVVDAGRIQPVVGTFASRRYSPRNPLIGEPDAYSIEYPLGVQLSGEARHFDYRAAMVSLPMSHEGYVPDPTPRLRPAIGGGITPFVGLRLGGSFTVGPYLNHGIAPALLFGHAWTSYDQRVVAADLAFSRGYLETHAEAARASFDVPGRASAIMGYTYYGEVKYTFTPRFFVATRVERNKYPFIHASATSWTARLTDFVDDETGVGYRFGANTLIKASLRADQWWVHSSSGARTPSGRAFALQLSRTFDALDWLNRDR